MRTSCSRWARLGSGSPTGGTAAASVHAQNVWPVNVSDTTTAFERAENAADSPVSNLHDKLILDRPQDLAVPKVLG